MRYSWTKGKKHQGKTTSQGSGCIRINDCIETAFSWEKQHWKMPGLHWFVFWRESFNASLPDSALVGWAEKSQQFNCLFVCSSQKSGQCPVSVDIHGRRSRKSSLTRTPAAILLWLKANAFDSAGALLLLFLVSIKLLWKSSTMVSEEIQGNEPRLQGALNCHVLPCCSSPFTEWLGTRPWKRQLPDTTDNV